MKIAVSSDERTHLVDMILEDLQTRGHEIVYFGPEKGQEADWPEVTVQAAECVTEGKADEAIVMCWTGTRLHNRREQGTRYPRLAVSRRGDSKRGAHWNHANALALSLRATSEAMAKEILNTWFETPYSTDEWNEKQMKRLSELEERYRR